MNIHYLDNSATTQVSKAAAEKACLVMRDNFANPSSLHSMGFEAAKEIESAREAVAETIGGSSAEIYFTSGGTEANNIAILGACEARKKRGNKIVTTALEHSSVYDSMLYLKEQGFEVVFLPTDSKGNINLRDAFEAIDSKTILVSLMHTNSEIGVINPISDIAAIIKRSGSPALFHCDAVQAFGKTPIRVSKLGVDLLSVSAHKIHGAKGVGALYIKKGTHILPRTYGGKQENKIRPGTENAPGIAAFGVAVKELDTIKATEHVSSLNSYLRESLSGIESIVINSPENGSPYILNFSTRLIRSETMLHYLASKNIFVSSGSACSRGGKSRVLTSLGLSEETIDTAIRVSFSKHNTKEDCDALIEGIKSGLNNLARR